MSDPRLDENGVWKMSKPVKIYVFKDEDSVKLSFRVTDYSNFSRWMTIDQFRHIAENWDKDEGVQGLETKNGKYFWYYSDSGPRPERVPASFVVCNINGWSLRWSKQDQIDLVNEFYHQLENKNHWD
jgi:hypothetical protein